MQLNYRNKTIFDWNTFEENDISSLTSLSIMKFMKNNLHDINIKNVIIRDVNNYIGIIIQLDDEINDKIYNIIYDFLKKSNSKLNYFALQLPINKIYQKGKNITIYKNEFIKFYLNYYDRKLISLLPDSFFQPNIKLLNSYYNKFFEWIKQSKSKNIINLGDDGGNICTILNNLFNNMISLFHCNQSYICAQEMIKDNTLNNFALTFNINDCKEFDKTYDNIILFINPGRKGLRSYEIDFIKNSLNIESIIYMACNLKAFERDKDQITKFKIIDSIEIDVMPNTKNTQNLLLLNKIE